jgi:uncharacterized protein YacL
MDFLNLMPFIAGGILLWLFSVERRNTEATDSFLEYIYFYGGLAFVVIGFFGAQQLISTTYTATTGITTYTYATSVITSTEGKIFGMLLLALIVIQIVRLAYKWYKKAIQ